MEWHLRVIETREEALTYAPTLERYAAEAHAEFSDAPFPAGACEAFVRASWSHKETLLIVAEGGAGRSACGICLIGGLEDPLLGWRTPLILVLHVVSEHRHRGLAGRLVTEAQRIMSGRGIPRLAGRVGHNDDALISMGERWGFVRHWELMLHE